MGHPRCTYLGQKPSNYLHSRIIPRVPIKGGDGESKNYRQNIGRILERKGQEDRTAQNRTVPSAARYAMRSEPSDTATANGRQDDTNTPEMANNQKSANISKRKSIAPRVRTGLNKH